MKKTTLLFVMLLLLSLPALAQPEQPQPGQNAKKPQWTAGIVSDTTNSTDTTVFVVTDFRTGRHETFDRLVLEFAESGIPNFYIAYVDMPVRRCGSAEPVSLQGEGWLMIRLYPAKMHKNGKSTIEKRDVQVNFPVLLRAVTLCDFEAAVEWVAALVSPNRFRVMQLECPPRLVVDISHDHKN